MSKEIKDCLIDLISNEAEKSVWRKTDKFFDIKSLSIDQRGRIGEHFFKFVFEQLGILDKYIDNAHGDWDIEANGFKIEVKTATLDVNNKFQHEGVKENKAWDIIAFLDITPNDIYITFIYKDDFEFGILNLNNNKSKVTGKVKVYDKYINIHYRGKDGLDERATGAGYKVDFKLNDLKSIESISDIKNLFEIMKKNHNL